MLKLRVELVGYLGKNAKFSRISAEYCLSDLVDKAGDVKNGSAIQEALSCVAEALSLDFVGREVMSSILIILLKYRKMNVHWCVRL